MSDSNSARVGNEGLSATRRRLLFAAAAAAAALAGGGAALWRRRPTSDVADDAVARLWGLSFETPQGAPLAMSGLKGRPLLINFWATWCPPCIEEMPLLDAFYRQNAAKGWQVLGLAIDQPSAVRTFLGRTPVSFPIGLAGLDGSQLSRSLGNLAGGLPYSIALGPDGRVLQRRMGRLTAEDLQKWAGLV